MSEIRAVDIINESSVTNERVYARIERIVPLPAVLWVPILECGHAGHCSTDRATVGQIGDQRRCLTCAREAKR